MVCSRVPLRQSNPAHYAHYSAHYSAYPSSAQHPSAYPSSAQHPSAYPSSSTIIPFDTRTYREEIASLPQYMASPTLLSKVTWQHSSNSLVVVSCQDQKPFVGIVVGTVLPYKMNCGPAGNYLSGKCDSLEKAKYRLYLSCPPQSTLAADYDMALNNLETIQNMAASTRDHKNMISVDATGKLVRAVTNVFERRVRCIIRSSGRHIY
ncbi:hypothetical protein M405DRAFT_925669 [Rhizopogon salebrosus TDB-379]|nr:hypothetical protein M405DRAFT_925669 [Rhizopogon salebrosus TDB-379]